MRREYRRLGDEVWSWPDPTIDATRFRVTRRLGAPLPTLEQTIAVAREAMLDERAQETVSDLLHDVLVGMNCAERVVRGRLMQHVRR